MKRRAFLKRSIESAGILAAARTLAEDKPMSSVASPPPSNAAKIPRRPYGNQGDHLSIVGFGGIVVTNLEQDEANRIVAEAVERGVNYFDVAPTYGDAEERLGPALEPYRKNAFLACKTIKRLRKEAEEEFNRSLERLRTDYFDLYQLHGLADVQKDVETAFAEGGVMELLLEAKKEGRIHYLGFSAHTEEAAVAAMDRYAFDSALFPINFATYYKGNFGPKVIERARKGGVTLLALKALARQKWPSDDPTREKYPKCWYQPLHDPTEADLGLRWSLSQPIAAAVPPGETPLFRLAMDIAARYSPITPEEDDKLKALAQTLDPIFQTG